MHRFLSPALQLTFLAEAVVSRKQKLLSISEQQCSTRVSTKCLRIDHYSQFIGQSGGYSANKHGVLADSRFF